jgi:hypothetical protein
MVLSAVWRREESWVYFGLEIAVLFLVGLIFAVYSFDLA